MDPKPELQLLTGRDAAATLGLSSTTITRYVREGYLKPLGRFANGGIAFERVNLLEQALKLPQRNRKKAA